MSFCCCPNGFNLKQQTRQPFQILLVLAVRIQLAAFVFRFFRWRNAGVRSVFWLSWLASTGWALTATEGGLRCKCRAEPMGLDVAQPRLSWVVTSDRRAETQTASQILVASSPEKLAHNEGDLWNSDRMAESKLLNIAYAGRPLVSQQTCFWEVRAWDRGGQPAEWRAQWISDPVLADPANRPLTPIHCYRSELTTNPAAASLAQVMEGGWPVAETTGVKWLRQEETGVLRVESGSYHFEVSL